MAARAATLWMGPMSRPAKEALILTALVAAFVAGLMAMNPHAKRLGLAETRLGPVLWTLPTADGLLVATPRGVFSVVADPHEAESAGARPAILYAGERSYLVVERSNAVEGGGALCWKVAK